VATSPLLVVGLGNPGPEYVMSRHNAGFMVLDALARGMGVDVDQSCCHALMGRGRLGGRRVILAKPQTFMNLSGRAVGALLAFFKIAPEDMVVVHDDIDLELGRLKMRVGGHHGGHNGVLSIEEHIGRKQYVRLRIGVGRPRDKGVTSYVLGEFLPEEEEVLGRTLGAACRAIETIAASGVAAAMTRFHRQKTAGADAPEGEKNSGGTVK
jgi:PTH1 family peptidyl-tRNA hydrolase